MSQNSQYICDYSDSDNEIVPPSPVTARRSSRLQCRTSPWAQWSSENIYKALENAGIPISQGLSREDILSLAYNTLGYPPVPTQTTPKPSTSTTQTKQSGRKRTAKSSSPVPAKRTSQLARAPSPPQCIESTDTNLHLISAVQNLSKTVKELQSKMTNLEHSFTSSHSSTDPAIHSSAIPQSRPPPSGISNYQSMPSTSASSPPSQLTIQTPFQNVSASPASSNFNLSTATPAQAFGRRFVPPAAATVSNHLRSNIIQGTSR
ncbi:mucin-5AC-like isoform X2 [Carassius auratus]|uniref:Mucin-5AC-like isoform X2 n=1 Tax=Carassius auratus TaxID=7957 RepID=A0A6P6PHI3_CARAU|nr:mucin-5AC-like isoform X2 [Carassius auratus]